VSKGGRKLIAETSSCVLGPYLFLHSVTCHGLLLRSTLAIAMHGHFNHESTKHLIVDQQREINLECRENWALKSIDMSQEIHTEMT